MAIVARLLLGIAFGISAIIIHSYAGEMSTRMDEIRGKQGKRPMKDVVYIFMSFNLSTAFVLSFGMFIQH